MVIVVISGVKLQLVLADVVDEPMLVVVEFVLIFQLFLYYLLSSFVRIFRSLNCKIIRISLQLKFFSHLVSKPSKENNMYTRMIKRRRKKNRGERVMYEKFVQ